MKKRLLSMIIAAALAAGLAASACADNTGGTGEHYCNDLSFETELQGELIAPLDSGSYYLSSDTICKNRLFITGEVRICLNGYGLIIEDSSILQIQDGASLKLYDCTGEGYVGSKDPKKESHPIKTDEGGTVNLYSVTVCSVGGPTAIENTGTLNIYNSVVSCDGTRSSGLAVKNMGTVNLYGADITAREVCIMQRWDNCSCTIHEGCVTLSSDGDAFSYASNVRPVKPAENLKYMYKSSEAGSYYEQWPQDYTFLNDVQYYKICVGQEAIDKVLNENTDASAASDAGPGEDKQAAEQDTAPAENTAAENQEADNPAQVEAVGQQAMEVISEEKEIEVNTFNVNPDSVRNETSTENIGMVITFIVVAAVSASAAVFFLVALKLKKRKHNY